MNTFFKYIKSLVIFLSSIVIIPIFLTIFNLFKLKTNRAIVIIIGALLMFIVGLILGKKSEHRGYLNGLLLSVISILILLLISLIFSFTLNINTLIYYVILVLATTLGSMLGINKKTKTN